MSRHASRSIVRLALAILLVAGLVRADEPYGRQNFEENLRDHWSFQPLVRPAVPEPGGDWGRNPIDAFVLARLNEARLKPAGPAEPAVLLRRVFLDLIGLPPSPAEVDRFLADSSPLALARVVDDLLARPQYGQRWARHWLDVVRYAETNGYERDGLKPQAWRFRDWVIEAFNDDKPYDRFLIEQLAGDEVPGSNAQTQLGATMLRLGPWDDEPADALADRYDQLDDIVGTTSATFMGLTLRCARCHDHKFEPLSQKDYSRWLAIFSPLKRPQKDRTDLERDLGPHADVMAHQQRVKQLDAKRQELEIEVDILAWRTCQQALGDGRLGNKRLVLAATSQSEPQNWRYTFDEPADARWILADFDDAAWKSGPGGFGTPGTLGAVVRTTWNTPAIWLRREFDLPEVPAASLKLLMQHDDDCEIYLNGMLATRAGGFIPEYRELPLSDEARAAVRVGRNTLAVHCRQTSGGQSIDVGVVARQESAVPPRIGELTRDVPREALDALAIEPPKRNDAQKKLLGKHRDQVRALVRELAAEAERAKLDDCGQQLQATAAQYPAPLPKGYIWYEERPQPAASHVFHRGDPRNPGDQVDPGFPAILVDRPPASPHPTSHSSGRRLQLARWLTESNHPLTARVLVNRLWQHHFGEGIVATENDFGLMGAAPTNQPLLDWLASELVSGGWHIKRIHRLIVLSQAYGQSSSATNAAAEKVDPTGTLLWRFPPRRLEAEALRDTILSVSGQLNLTAGGPGVYPKISREVMETQSRPGDGWHTSSPNDAARRSVYVFVKRTLLVPELEVLDFPSTEETCEQRVVSTVAPQALTFLNGEFIHEQAQALANRLTREAGADPAARVERAYRLALSRSPTEKERTAVTAFLAKQQSQIEADSTDQASSASEQNTVGQSNAAGQPNVDAASRALAAFCLVLLNTNELAYIR